MPEALPSGSKERGPLKTCLVRGLGCLTAFTVVTVGGGALLANWLNSGNGGSNEASPSDTHASAAPFPSETAEEEPSQLTEPSEEPESTAAQEPTNEDPTTAAPQNASTETATPQDGGEQNGNDCPWSPSNPQPLSGKSIKVFPGCMGVTGGFDTYAYSRQQMNGSVHLDAGQEVIAACAWPGQTFTGVITADGKKALLDDRAAGYVGYVNGKPGLDQCSS